MKSNEIVSIRKININVETIKLIKELEKKTKYLTKNIKKVNERVNNLSNENKYYIKNQLEQATIVLDILGAGNE